MSLTLHGVHRSFGGDAAVAGVDLEVPGGQVVALCGPNGAGKSTVVNLASGFLRPEQGAVVVDGRDLTGRPAHAFARAGVVRTFQGLRLFEGMTVLDNVLVGASRSRPLRPLSSLVRGPASRRQERQLRERADAVLGEVGVAALAGRPVGALSQGQRRRVELARALAATPSYLILDEPGAGVDPGTVDVLVDLVRARATQGVGVLLVEHDGALLARLADTAVALVAGRVLARGRYDEVARQADVAAQRQAAR